MRIAKNTARRFNWLHLGQYRLKIEKIRRVLAERRQPLSGFAYRGFRYGLILWKEEPFEPILKKSKRLPARSVKIWFRKAYEGRQFGITAFSRSNI